MWEIKVLEKKELIKNTCILIVWFWVSTQQPWDLCSLIEKLKLGVVLAFDNAFDFDALIEL